MPHQSSLRPRSFQPDPPGPSVSNVSKTVADQIRGPESREQAGVSRLEPSPPSRNELEVLLENTLGNNMYNAPPIDCTEPRFPNVVQGEHYRNNGNAQQPSRSLAIIQPHVPPANTSLSNGGAVRKVFQSIEPAPRATSHGNTALICGPLRANYTVPPVSSCAPVQTCQLVVARPHELWTNEVSS